MEPLMIQLYDKSTDLLATMQCYKQRCLINGQIVCETRFEINDRVVSEKEALDFIKRIAELAERYIDILNVKL